MVTKTENLTPPKYCAIEGLHYGRSTKQPIQYTETSITENITTYIVTKWPTYLINFNFNITNSCLYNYWEEFYIIRDA
jgi:hypothetical protein